MAIIVMKTSVAWILLMAVFISELFVYTWCRVQCTGMKYSISSKQRTLEKTNALQKQLKIESARLKSPKRIAQIAIRQLDLSMPRPEQIIIIRE